MKRILTASLCLAMAAIACNKMTPAEPENANGAITVSACIPVTKITSDKGKVSWSEGDAIAIYNTSGEVFTLKLSEGAGTNYGKFSGGFSGTIGSIAIFPAEYAGTTPGTVTIPKYVDRTDKINVVMASGLSVNGNEVEATGFHHVMALMEFTLTDVPAYARAFKLWSKTGAQLNGTYEVTSALDGVVCGNADQDADNSERVVVFPYKSAYGPGEELKFYIPLPSYDYTDLAARVLDGDESVIEGTGKYIPAASASLKAGDYVAMPALNVRKLVADNRDNYVKVEGVKWAKGNLRAWEAGTDGDGWQSGWNIYDNQWEGQYALTHDTSDVNGDSKSFSLGDSSFKNASNVYAHWDYFSWGTLSRSSRVHNCPITCSVANFDISGKVFDLGAAKGDISTATELSGDERWADVGTFQGTNSTIVGDIAFWASKGKYRMPKKGEVQKLYAKSVAGAGSDYAHMQAGYYMAGDKKINGILFTSCPSWETTTYNTTAIELDDADLESGLFLPKIGERTVNDGGKTYNSGSIKFFNSWGAYWSGTYGGMNEGFEDCAVHIFFTSANAMNYGYTGTPSNTISGQTKLGNALRPVYIPEKERQ